ncbi:MAG: type II toxin-antitoxin system VapC family toxin [Ornithinimicrobium sp.]|uniref:type II toxin-antitoxin system VapC family toxin n=1 Tax=Ornithinimicrobium sp. TaxID=1977084 RepID=UPI003D9B8FC0
MIYLDSSAAMKLVWSEEETTALIEWLERAPDEPVITSELGRVEVLRAARRLGDEAVTAQARAVIAEFDLIALDRTVKDLACDIADPPLRTLDALHLASALVVREHLSAFVAYDHRLATAARDAGLEVAAPGQAP